MTAVALRGRRVVVFGHDSMGMETALAHVLPTRNTFGLEITRLDMKLLADMLTKKAYDDKELKDLRGWIDRYVGKRLELRNDADSERFNQSLAMYLIVRDLMADLNAVGGGFMSQLEWGSDPRGIPLPVADVMESLLQQHVRPQRPQARRALRHRGRRAGPADDAVYDVSQRRQSRRCSWTSARSGRPGRSRSWPRSSASRSSTRAPTGTQKGLVDGDNSGSAAFDWAAAPGATVKQIMERVSMPLADAGLLPRRRQLRHLHDPRAASRASPPAWPTAASAACSA